MRLTHLTETEIQEILDNRARFENSPTLQHLSGCDSCRAMMEDYRKLYSTIERVKVDPLSSKFADRVMAAITPQVRTRTLSLWNAVGALLLATAGLVAAIIVLPIDGTLTAIWGGVVGEASRIFLEAGKSISTVFRDTGWPLEPFVFSILLLALFGGLDHLLREARRRPTTIRSIL